MLAFAVGELIVLAVAWAAFVVTHLLTPKWWRNSAGLLVMMMAVVNMLEFGSLAMLGLGHPLPVGGYAVIFGLNILVLAGWTLMKWWTLWASWRSRRDPASADQET